MRVAIVGTYIFLSETTEARLRALGCEIRKADSAPTADTLLAESAGAEVLVTWGRIDPDTARTLQARGLGLLVLMSTGAEESIDPESMAILSSGGVVVCHTPDYSTTGVAEFALTLALAMSRRLLPPLQDTTLTDLQGREIRGSSCGVFGLGAIGTAVADRAAALGASVMATTRNPSRHRATATAIEFVDLGEMAKRSDFLFITASHNSATRATIAGQHIEALPQGAIVVNVARPEILDPASVHGALQHRQDIRLAVDGDAAIRDSADWKPLAALSNVVWTPHIAFNTGRSLLRCTEVVADVIEAFQAGRILHGVNP